MPYTLLLADASTTIQRIVELTFASEDIDVVAFSNGEHAIASLDRNVPDIVLADVGMPGRSGYEVSRYIKNSPPLAHIPVLLLTGAFEPVDQAKALEAGCDGILIKPFEPKFVIGRVKELLKKPKPGAREDEVEQYFDELDKAFADLSAAQPVPARRVDVEAPAAVPVMAQQLQVPEAAHAPELVPYASLASEPASHSVAVASASHGIAPESQSQSAPAELASHSFAAKPAAHPSMADTSMDDSHVAEPGDDLAATVAPAGASTDPASSAAAPSAPVSLALVPPAAAPEPVVEIPAPIAPVTPPATAAPPARRPTLAEAFTALLQAEGSGNGKAPVLTPAASTVAVPSDELIERVSRRVLDQLTDAVVRETVIGIVQATTERLVREEIERIKSNIK